MAQIKASGAIQPTLAQSASTDLKFAEFLSDVVARFDPQFRHTYVNSAVELFTGRPANEFLGKSNRELGMPTALVDYWDSKLGEVFRTGQPTDVQFSFEGPGGLRHFCTRITPEKNASGVVASVLTFARDVTAERVLADACVAAGGVPGALDSEYFRSIIDSSDDAIIGKDLQGVVTSWNRGAQRIFGYTAAEMLGNSLLVLFPPERQQEESFILERILLGEKVDHFETVRLRKNGERVHLSVSISPIRDNAGRIIGASKVARDITPLKVEQERLQFALDAAGTGLWDWDLRSGVVYRTPHYYEVVGYKPEDDTHDFAFFKRTVHPDDLPHAMQTIEDYRQGKTEHIEFEYRLVSSKGKTDRWLQGRGRAVERNLDGFPVRIVGTLNDISNSKKIDLETREREKRLSRVLDGSDQGYWEWNLKTNDFQVSARWETMLGYAPGEIDVAPEKWGEKIHLEDFDIAMENVNGHIAGTKDAVETEMRCRNKAGGWTWILSQGRIVEWDTDGKPLLMSGTHTDISERKKSELEQQEAITVFASSYEGMMVVGADLRITKVNPAFTRITGYLSGEVVGQLPSMLSSGLQSQGFYKEMWASVRKHQFWAGEIWNRRKTGEVYAEHLSISVVKDKTGVVQHYIGIFSDISQIKAHESELDRAAHYDPLTGVPNRRLLTDRLEQAIGRTTRSESSLAVCYLDLDGFKAVNDQFGHATGDTLLKSVAAGLKKVLRGEDTLARLGGDEFVLLLSDIGTPAECSLILERVLEAVAEPMDIDGHKVQVSASIGVSLYPQDHVDADTLLRHADQAMYLAKESGKNRFHLFDPSSDKKAQLHRQRFERLSLALDHGEFCLYYQPKVDLGSGRIVGAEALIRWQHPENGLLPPGEFLQYMEGSELECAVGAWVIETALLQAENWRTQGEVINVSVNISANHLLQAEFLPELQQALLRHPLVAPSHLELEVLESTAISDMSRAVDVLQQCKRLGVQLALDDFGTGYSSLTYLRKLPVDTLKIDQSFVRGMLNDREDFGIVEGVVRLAIAFERKVIAEGVESLEHGAALLKLGCHFAQGYGIARPMPAEKFLEWTKEWRAVAPRFAFQRAS